MITVSAKSPVTHFSPMPSSGLRPPHSAISRGILFRAPMVLAQLDGRKTQTRRVMNTRGADRVIRVENAVLVPQRAGDSTFTGWVAEVDALGGKKGLHLPLLCPYGEVGGGFYVKETHRNNGENVVYRAGGECPVVPIELSAGLMPESEKWRPAIFMPRWAARIRNRITAIHAERLQDITDTDAIAEGIESTTSHADPSKVVWRDYQQRVNDPFEWFDSPVESYRSLWNSISLKPSPVYDTIEDKRQIIGYVSHPWSNEDFDAANPGARASGRYRRKPLTVITNPWVWVLTFQRIQP